MDNLSIERLFGDKMKCSDEDLGKLNDAYKKVINGTMLMEEYNKLRDSTPGATKPKNKSNAY